MLLQILIPVAIFIGLAVITGVLLSIFSKIFAVETDERVERIVGALPGLNCGVCGYSGCENYANELVSNDAPTNKCIPGGDNAAHDISEILGKNFKDVVGTIAFVRCDGAVPRVTQDRYTYHGERTCAACNMYYQGKGSCDFGCIGFGDCIRECQYGAICIVDEVAIIDPLRCKGCTLCVKSCPKGLIALRDANKKIYVKCKSCNTGKETISKCANGCIGCKKCEKECQSGAITVKDNLASIDYDKCTNCQKCLRNCPKHCIGSSEVIL